MSRERRDFIVWLFFSTMSFNIPDFKKPELQPEIYDWNTGVYSGLFFTSMLNFVYHNNMNAGTLYAVRCKSIDASLKYMSLILICFPICVSNFIFLDG